jgi:predicted transcriptional regulator
MVHAEKGNDMKKSFTTRIDSEILERMDRLIEASGGYLTRTKIFEKGAVREMEELEKLFKKGEKKKES